MNSFFLRRKQRKNKKWDSDLLKIEQDCFDVANCDIKVKIELYLNQTIECCTIVEAVRSDCIHDLSQITPFAKLHKRFRFPVMHIIEIEDSFHSEIDPP